MPATPSGTSACPDGSRHERLAVQLADLIPGAVALRVTLLDPRMAWPHPTATAYGEAGQRLPLSRTTATTAARWVLRVWPEADWNRPHAFDLKTATLTPFRPIASRGC